MWVPSPAVLQGSAVPATCRELVARSRALAADHALDSVARGEGAAILHNDRFRSFLELAATIARAGAAATLPFVTVRKKPWGFTGVLARESTGAGRVTEVKLLVFAPDSRTSLHAHRHRTEVHIPLTNTLLVQVPASLGLDVHDWCAFVVRPGEVHRFCTDREAGFIATLNIGRRAGRDRVGQEE